MKYKSGLMILTVAALGAFALCACGQPQNDSDDDNIDITLDKTQVSLDLYDIAEINVAGNQGGVSWSTDNADVATVDSDGRIAAVGEGSCYIIAADGDGSTGKCKVTVTDSGARPELTLNFDSLEIGKGVEQNLQCTLSYKDAMQSDFTVKYRSGDYTVAAVYADGRVSGGRLGETTVTAVATWRDRTVEETLPVTVKSVELNEKAATLDMYDELKLTALAKDKTGVLEDAQYEWSSGDEDVAVVDNGKVTPCGEGETDIKVKISDNVYSTCRVTVHDSGARPELNISNTDLTFNLNGEKTVTAALMYKGKRCADAQIVFTPENDDIVSVDKNGKITMIDYGSTKVTVSTTWRGKEYTEDISVVCASLVMDKTSLTLDRYEEDILTPSYRGNTGSAITETLTWATSNAAVVTVDNGKLSVVGIGSADITVSAPDGTKATCKVTVHDSGARPELELSSTDLTFNINGEKTVDASLMYKGKKYNDVKIEFAPVNGDIVSVDNSGKITMTGYGSTTVTASATWRGMTLSKDIAVLCASLVMDRTTLTLDRYDEDVLSPSYRGNTGNAITETLTWGSSNAAVVTVDNGKLSVVGIGSADITVSAPDGTKATCKVTVEDSGERPVLTLDELPTLLEKGNRVVVSGYVTYKDVVYDSITLECTSDSSALSVAGDVMTGVWYGDANFKAAVTWRTASLEKTSKITVYAEYFNPMSDDILTAKWNELGLAADPDVRRLEFVTADYRSTGAVYAISKSVYDGMCLISLDSIQNAEQAGIVKETDIVYGWHAIDPYKLGLFLNTWYDMGKQWGTSAFRIQPMIKEIEGCYFLWMGNCLTFSDPHDGGWNDESCTQIYWVRPEGLANEDIAPIKFIVEIDNHIKIQKPIADGAGTGLIYEITENIYGTFKYTGETLIENGVEYKRIADDSIGLFTDWGKAQYYDCDILAKANGYDSFADFQEASAYAGYDAATGKCYLWFKSFDKFTISIPNNIDNIDKRSTLVWTSVDGKKCEHTVRTNVG